MFNTTNPPAKKQYFVVITSICLLLTLFIYRPFGLYFLNDDLIHIPWSGEGVFLQQGFLRCAHNMLSFAEIKLFGNSPVWFHAVSLLLHLLCSYFFYVLCKQVLLKYADFTLDFIKSIALLATAFFLVYAFHSESVLWIIGSVSSMATLFFLLSLICYFKAENKVFYFIWSILFFLIALLTYENVWVMPMLVWIFFLADVQKNKNYKGWIYPTIVAVVFLIHLYIRIKLIGQLASNYETKNVSHFNIITLILNYNRLVARSLLPPMQSVPVFMAAYAIALMLIAWRFFVLFKQKSLDILILALLACTLVSFLPVISLGIDTHGTGAERYLYLPSVFLCMLFAYLIMKWQTEWQKKLAIIIIVLCFNGFYALKSSSDYHLASNLSKNILASAAAKMNNANTYQVYGLPSMINRVKVLDIGFKEGMAWLYNKDSSKIKEMSKFEAVTKNHQAQPINFTVTMDTNNMMQVLFDTAQVKLTPYAHVDD